MSDANVRPLAYSVPEAAGVAGVSRAHLYRAMQVGDLASVKTGSRRVVLHDDLVAWLRGQREIVLGAPEAVTEASDATAPAPRTRATRRPTRRTRRRHDAAQAALPLAD